MVPSNIISWYVVQFKPNSHKIALRNLQRQGFETFLPMHEVTRSYCQIWCLRVFGHAATWPFGVVSIPSLNATPVMTLAR